MTLIKQWLNALRSGEYGQTSSTLKEEGDNRYCCLGVLVEVHPDFYFDYTLHPEDYYNDAFAEFQVQGPGGRTFDMEYAPDPIADAIGLNDTPPDWLSFGLAAEVDTIQFALASHNDNGKSFEEIAALIARLYDEGLLRDPA